MNTDRYVTLGRESEGHLREKASKFIALAFPITDETHFTQRWASITKEHHASRHVCYAWVLGENGDRFRANDAGEPSGTAGRPILRRLQGAKLTFAAIVVVRYFGGTLLGRAGLVHAYAEAARAALADNTILVRVLRTTFLVHCSYALVERLKDDVARCEGEVISAEYAGRCSLRIAIARGQVASFTERWSAVGAEVSTDHLK